MRRTVAFALNFVIAVTAAAQEFEANGLLVASGTLDRVAQLDAGGAVVDQFGVSVGISTATDLAIGPNGNLFVSSRDTGTVFEIAPTGIVVNEFGAGSGLADPTAITFGPYGHLYVSSSSQDVVYEFDERGSVVRTIGIGSGLMSPRGITFGPNGHLYVASHGTDRVLEFAPNGAMIREIGVGSALSDPERIAFAGDMHLFVASSGNGRIVEFDEAFEEVQQIGVGLGGVVGCAVGPDGRIYATDPGDDTVSCYDRDGALHDTYVDAIDSPQGLTFAPFRFRARATGQVGRAGDKVQEFDENIEIAVSPERHLVMVAFVGDEEEGSKIAAVTGEAVQVFHGYETYDENKGSARWAQGAQIPDRAAERGVGSLVLKVKGEPNGDDRFVPESFSGTIQCANGAFVLSGKVKSKKLLK